MDNPDKQLQKVFLCLMLEFCILFIYLFQTFSLPFLALSTFSFFQYLFLYVCMYVHIYISKCNILCLYNVTGIYIFKVDHLFVLDSQLVCSSLGKAISPTCSISLLPLVLWVGLWPCGLFLLHFGMSIICLDQLMFKTSCW